MLDGTEYLECACHSDEHTLRFTLSLDDDPEIYTSVFLGSYPWGWRCILTGIKYLFGYKCKFGHSDCFIMKPEDAERLRVVLDKLIEARRLQLGKK